MTKRRRSREHPGGGARLPRPDVRGWGQSGCGAEDRTRAGLQSLEGKSGRADEGPHMTGPETQVCAGEEPQGLG